MTIRQRCVGAVMTKQRSPTIRILFGSSVSLGPGKVALLEAIGRTGSISAAAREMGMSYRRAWLLVDAMNRSFRSAVVETAAGGQGGGGARVTELGKDLLVRYREIEEKAVASIADDMSALREFLADPEVSQEVA